MRIPSLITFTIILLPVFVLIIFILQELVGRTERGARKLMKRGEYDSISIWRLLPDMQI